MKTYALIALIGATLIACSFCAGRFSAPVSERTVIATTTRESEVHIFGRFQSTSSSKSASEAIRWRERVIYRDGAVVEVIREVDKSATSTSNETKTSTETTADSHLVTKQDTRTTEKTRPVDLQPRFQLSAGVGAKVNPGLGFVGPDIGGAVRVWGPIWVGVNYAPLSKEVLTSARLLVTF